MKVTSVDTTQHGRRFTFGHAQALAVNRLASLSQRGSLSTILFILTTVCAGVAGQLALKHGMTQLGAQTFSTATLLTMITDMLTSPWVLLGLLFYVAGTFFWLMVLSRVDLSLAYPMLSTSYILVIASSWLLLGESVSMLRIAGAATILTGVILVTQSRARRS